MEGEPEAPIDGTVLIVDEDLTTRVLAREALEREGFAVAETHDEREILDVFDQINPDIIILDLLSQDTNGFTICRKIREHPEGQNTPILMMTGLDDLDSIRQAYETGATDFISKPCNFLVLSYRVRYMLRANQTLKELAKSRATLSYAQRLAQIGSWEWDVKNDILQWSEAIYRIFEIDPYGFDRTYHAFLNSVHPMDRESVNFALKDALAEKKELSLDHQIITSDGATRHVHTEAKVIDDKYGNPVLVTGTVQDITVRKRYEEQIRTLAYFDSLTSLPNRVLFKENLARALNRAGRRSLKVATMFIDMDHFKEINDTLGHEVGDMLLQGLAERLKGCVRKVDRIHESNQDMSNCPVSRLGGDEFTVILDDLRYLDDASRVAQRIIDVMVSPFDLEGQSVSVTVSIGISIYPDDGLHIITLLKHADIAMYHAKNKGRNNFCFYTEVQHDKRTK